MKVPRKFLLVFCLFFTFLKTEAHPYHISLAEVKYNAKTQKLEIALKIFTDDLEKTLSETAKKVVVVKQSPEFKKQLETYLQQHFRLESATKNIYPQRFLGFETEDDAQWLYFEIPVIEHDLKNAKLRNQILMQTYSDQMNLVNLHVNGQRTTLIFKEGEVLKPLF